jgi:putative ABC transport system permease protein
VRSRITSFVRNLLLRGRVEQELDNELRSYAELVIQEKRAAGLTEEEARRGTLLELGGFDQVKEHVRDIRVGALVDQLRQDLFYAARMLRKNVGFTAVAVTTLALGIGATAAMFSVVDTVVFRPLPYEDPDSLVKICGTGPRDRACDDDFSLQELESLREHSKTFEQIAADDGMGVIIARPEGGPESLGVGLVSTNWLSTLGVRPLVGRDFTPEEARPGRDRVVILTHDYWRRHFAFDTEVIGTTLTFEEVLHTVIGVLPPNVLRSYADVLKPLVPTDYSGASLDVFGRLSPGVTLAQARAEVELIGRRLQHQQPGTGQDRRFGAQPLGKEYAFVAPEARRGLVLMLGAVGFVLLIACANVASLLIARAGARRREYLVRAALGASRGRLVRQFLIESMLLFVLGGAAGVFVARLSLDSLTALAVSGGYVPERLAVTADMRALGISLFASFLTGLAFGLAPALQASRVDLNVGLRDATHTLTSDRRRGRSRRLLIVSEIALSLVLLAGFGLLIRSFGRIYATSGGFDPEHVVVTASDGGRSFRDAMLFWRAALARARAIPGVTSAALTSRPPMYGARRQHFVIEGRAEVSPEDAPQAGDILVSDDYFRTLRIPLLKGRRFTSEDDERARPVAIISQSLARRYFRDEDPIGRHIRLLERSPMSCCVAPVAVDGIWREVIGVVGDIRQASLEEEPAQTIYRPYAQIVEHDMFLVLRAHSAADASRIATGLRAELTAVDPNRMWLDGRAMWQVIGDSMRLRRFVLILLGSFAEIALVLAAIGIYGVASSAVAERTKEIAIRIALGATRPIVFREALREMMTLASVGVALGVAGALALTRLIQTMLFGITATDGVTYFGVALLLAGVVLLATYIPARRATQIDPMATLRNE